MFHLTDNKKLTVKDGKVAPLHSSLSDAFLRYGVFHRKFRIDELVVPYFGRHRCKIFIRVKPIRFGCKIWCLFGSDGFPYHLSICTGKLQEKGKLFGSCVINAMVDIVEYNSTLLKQSFYFDNFFTSYQFLLDLSIRRVISVGSVRENRKVMNTKSEIKKLDRGTYLNFCLSSLRSSLRFVLFLRIAIASRLFTSFTINHLTISQLVDRMKFLFLQLSFHRVDCVQYAYFKIFSVDAFWKTNQLDKFPPPALFLLCQPLLNFTAFSVNLSLLFLCLFKSFNSLLVSHISFCNSSTQSFINQN